MNGINCCIVCMRGRSTMKPATHIYRIFVYVMYECIVRNGMLCSTVPVL
jgi:hypothetical protein